MKFARNADQMTFHSFSHHALNANSRLGTVLRAWSTKIKAVARGQPSITVIEFVLVISE